MPRKEIQKIYGYVDLTEDMREWMKAQMRKGNMQYARGWQCIPAHHRENPLKGIILHGYPDCEESFRYWFDNPQKRDRSFQIMKEPLPIMSERDKQFFYEENAKCQERHGFKRYVIYRSNRDFIQEYSPESDFIEKKNRTRQEVANNIGPEVEPVKVASKSQAPEKKDALSSRLVNAE